MKSQLKNRFLEFILQKQLFQSGERVLVAVSGGVDSMVLLHLLLNCRKRLKLELGVIHLHHQLRGRAADADRELVKTVAEKYELPFFSLRHSVRSFAREKKLSLEEAGHLLREKLFTKLAREQNYQKIATAHQLDDQAETVLMRMLRGSGLSGLAAIRLRREKWVRPLLFASRQEIENYALEQQISFREDRTNKDLSIIRNKIRHQLLPLLTREYNPSATQQLAQLATIFAEWEHFLQPQLQQAIQQHLKAVSENKFEVGIDFFKQYFSWVRIPLIEYVMQQFGHKDVKMNFQQFSDFSSWVERGKMSSRFQWTPSIVAVKHPKCISFIHLLPDTVHPQQLKIEWGETYLIPDSGDQLLLAPVQAEEVTFSENKNEEYIAGERLKFPLLLRNWQAGDRFIPLGMQKSRLVSDFLTDLKIAFPEKKKVKVLLNHQEIVALLGIQISNRYRIQSQTQKIYRLTIKKNRLWNQNIY